MRIERTRKEWLALGRLCGKAIYEGPRLRGPDPETHISKKTARERGRLLVKHCLDKPVTEHG